MPERPAGAAEEPESPPFALPARRVQAASDHSRDDVRELVDRDRARSSVPLVLVAEFDDVLSGMMDALLRSSGRQVLRTRSRRDTWSALFHLSPDLVVLPADGHAAPLLDAVRQLRVVGDRTGVIVIGRPEDRGQSVRQLRMGADDFLTRPLELAEFECRVDALLRRVRASRTLVRFGGRVTIDPAMHAVLVEGRPLPLTAREFSVVWVLAVHANRIVRTSDIAQAVFQSDSRKSRAAVHVLTAGLRRRLSTFAGELSLQTAPGSGYILTFESVESSTERSQP